MSDLENNHLIEFKENILDNFAPCEDFETSFSFHGVSLSLFSNSRELIKEVDSFIPSDWKSQRCSEKHYIIYHRTIPQSDATWDDESSSLLYKKNQTIIQRDFAARVHDEQTVYVYFPPFVCDGFYNFFRWFLSEKLIDHNKAILHSSALLDQNQRAHIFLGPSGAGKTTVTELSKPRTILSDDMNLIGLNGDGSLYCAPGAVGGLYVPQVEINQVFPVANFYWLIQDHRHQINEKSKIKQYQNLYASLANITWQDSSQGFIDRTWQLCQNILTHHQVYDLHFKKDSEFWNLINLK